MSPDAIDSFITRWENSGAAEEKRGLIRWLRPDCQNPSAAAPQPVQATLTGTESASSLKTEN